MSRYLLALSGVLYVACLPWDAFCVHDSCSNWPSWSILAFGFIPFAASPANLAWFANPALFMAWVLVFRRKRWPARLLSLASLAIAVSFLLMSKVASDESGNLSVITGYRIGYWLWLASTGVAVASALPLSKRAKGGDDRERPTRALS
jgi:hypothetical protein